MLIPDPREMNSGYLRLRPFDVDPAGGFQIFDRTGLYYGTLLSPQAAELAAALARNGFLIIFIAPAQARQLAIEGSAN